MPAGVVARDSRAVLRVVSALGLRAIATLLALVLLVLLAWQYGDRTTRPALGETRPVPLADRNPIDQGCSRRGPVTVHLLLQQLDLRAGVVTIDPTLCVPAAVVRSLESDVPRSWTNAGAVVRETLLGPRITRAFRDSTILFKVGSAEPPTIRTQAIRLGSLRRPEFVNGVLVRRLREQVLPVVGAAQDYPLDEYSLDLYAVLQLDGLVVYHPRRSRGYAYELPLAVTASVASDLRGLRAEQSFDGDSWIAIRLRRPLSTEAFVAALLLIPLLLIAVLVRTTGAHSAHGTEVVVGAAAVLLALLPLRAVLVPSEVSALTLVDYALAGEVALLTALVVWRETRA